MSSAKIVMALAFFLTMKATTAPPPSYCVCRNATNIRAPLGCVTIGCSLGTNPFCNNGYFDTDGPAYAVFSGSGAVGRLYSRYGCNCPDSPSNATHNAYYGPYGYVPLGYNYITCTGFGGNARDTRGNVPPDSVVTTICCNFCCNRTDPYPVNIRG